MKREGSKLLTICLKLGDVEARKEIMELLMPSFLSLCYGKFSWVLAKQMALTTFPAMKQQLFGLVKLHVSKLLRSPESAQVLEKVYESSNSA